jgi:hypothetical protein
MRINWNSLLKKSVTRICNVCKVLISLENSLMVSLYVKHTYDKVQQTYTSVYLPSRKENIAIEMLKECSQ